LGRFTTTDPFSGNVNDPRTFNPYAYGFNNPFGYVDEYGEFNTKAFLLGALWDLPKAFLWGLPKQTVLMIIDLGEAFSIAGWNKAHPEAEIYADDAKFKSLIGQMASSNISQHGQYASWEALKPFIAQFGSAGIYGLDQVITECTQLVQEGKLTIEEADRRVSRYAGSLVGVALLGSVSAKTTTGSWTGEQPNPLLQPQFNSTPDIKPPATQKPYNEPPQVIESAKLEAAASAESEITSTSSATKSAPRTWNEFQAATKGMYESRAEAGKAWEVYKTQQGIVTGTVRSSAQKAKFLKQLGESGKAPKWMNQWLKEGKVPPGYEVDHIKPLSIGGEDIPSNMRLVDIDFHHLHHSPGFYRPWE